MTNIEPHILFNKLLEENNLTAQLVKPKVRYLEDGAILVEQPQLLVYYTNPITPQENKSKEEEHAGSSTQETNKATN